MTDNIFMAILSKIKKINTQITNVNQSVADVKSSLPTDYATQSSVDEIKTTIDGMLFGDAKEESVQAVLTKLDSIGGGEKSTIAASSTKLKTVTLSSAPTKSTKREVAYFQVKNVEGTLRVLFTEAYGRYGLFRIYLNGAAVYYQETSTTDAANLTCNLYVNPGDVIGIVYGSNNASYYAYLTSVSICGTITGDGTVALISDVANQGT